MSERRKFTPDWELMKIRLDTVRIKAKFGAEQLVHDVKYKVLVSRETHEQASLASESFAGETMGFLGCNLTAKLKPLHPTKEQVGLFRFLIDSVAESKLAPKSTSGKVHPDIGSYVVKTYRATEHRQADCGDDLCVCVSRLRGRKDVSLVTRWGVEGNIVPGFGVFGSFGLASPGRMDFLAFPKKVGSAEEVQQLLGIPEEQNGFRNTVGVFNEGERIILNQEGEYRGEEISLTDQYHLMGAFDGQGTQRSYWLYGSNYEHNKMSVKPKVNVRKFAPQTLNNGQ